MAQAIHRINAALSNEEGSAATLEAIKSPVLALRSITDECSDTYHTKLMEAQKSKAKSAGKDGISLFRWSQSSMVVGGIRMSCEG